MQPHSPYIDHFVVGSADPDALEAQFIRLGFTLRPRSALSGAGLGLCNRGIFLEGSRYIELLSVIDPDAVARTRQATARATEAYGVPAILAVRSGLIRLAISTGDIPGARVQAIELGYEVEGPVRHSVDFMHEGQRFQALCEVIHATRPDTRTLGCYFVNYLQDYDPGPFRTVPHPNGVVDAHAAVVVGAPEAVQPFVRLMSGGSSSTDMLEVMQPSEWEALTGLQAERSHALPYLAGMVFTVKDLTQTERWMTEQAIGVRTCGDRLIVPPDEAGNTALFFEQRR
jgi:hypothetical protein